MCTLSNQNNVRLEEIVITSLIIRYIDGTCSVTEFMNKEINPRVRNFSC